MARIGAGCRLAPTGAVVVAGRAGCAGCVTDTPASQPTRPARLRGCLTGWICPYARVARPRRRQGPAGGGAFGNGETQTRTGDTTIFSHPSMTREIAYACAVFDRPRSGSMPRFMVRAPWSRAFGRNGGLISVAGTTFCPYRGVAYGTGPPAVGQPESGGEQPIAASGALSPVSRGRGLDNPGDTPYPPQSGRLSVGRLH